MNFRWFWPKNHCCICTEVKVLASAVASAPRNQTQGVIQMLNYWVQRPTHWDDIISNLEHTFKSLTLTAQMTNRLVWFTHSDMHCIFHTVNQTDLVWMLNLRPEQKMCSMCFHRVKHMLNGEDVLRIWKKCLWAVWNALRCLALVLPWSTAAGTLTCCMVTVSRLWCFNHVC